jgi:hypothetical protein
MHLPAWLWAEVYVAASRVMVRASCILGTIPPVVLIADGSWAWCRDRQPHPQGVYGTCVASFGGVESVVAVAMLHRVGRWVLVREGAHDAAETWVLDPRREVAWASDEAMKMRRAVGLEPEVSE